MKNPFYLFKNFNFIVKSFLIIILCMLGKSLAAQPYIRTTFNASYVPITTSGGAIVSTATGNDANQAAVNLGFTFNYAGTNYTAVGINTNGFLWFDATTPSVSTTNNSLFSTAAPNQCLTAWWNDMIDDATSDILYQTQGSAGSRTFTVQYTNYPNSSGTNGTNVRINCQIILYETSGIIEYRYGAVTVSGTIGAHTGAAIGLEYGTGGKGNFIDAVTGSNGTTNRMLTAIVSWPDVNYRFTPGTPTAVAGGTYNVGIGQTYTNLSLAVADLNHRGISGPVTLNLTDNNYDTTAANGNNRFPIILGPVTGNNATNTLTISKTGTPATIAYRGSNANGSIGCYGSISSFTEIQEPILGISTSYTTVSNINLVSHGSTPHLVDRGLLVFQADAALGAQHNLLDKISVDLDRTNTNTIGIEQTWTVNAAGLPGSNSYNTYRDFNIRDCSKGMNFIGAGGAGHTPDYYNQITTSNCNTFNSIGDPAVANDIGGTSALTYGIKMHNQVSFKIKNNIIRNVSTTSTSQVDGIFIQAFQGTCEISNNIIRTITRTSTSGNQTVSGIHITTSGNDIKKLKVFNNSVSEILSTYSGAATAIRVIKGIFVDGGGNVGKQVVEFWNNSVSITGAGSLNASNTCFEISDPTDVQHIVKNNVFANFTPAQSGVARHYCWVTPLANRIGYSTFSESDYNDLYISTDQGTSGHVGLGSTTNYSTLANWQSGITFQPGTDVNSNSANPFYINNNSNLHGSPASFAIDGTGTTPPSYTTQDIDCQVRSIPYDKGFDDFSINDSISLLGSFNPSGTGSLCGIGYDPDSAHIWVYGCSAGTIQRYTTTGTLINAVNVAGGTANDVDVEVAPQNLSLNNGNINKGQMLLINGESGAAEIYAYSKSTGLPTDTLITTFGSSHVVGGSYHEIRNTFFMVQDNVPAAALENMVAEVNPLTGATLQTFQTTANFSVSFGDIEVGANGNLFIVSSVEEGIAEYTPTGTFVQIHDLPDGVSDLSGIALDCGNSEAWVSSENGNVYHLGNFPCGTTPVAQLNLGLFIEGFISDIETMQSPIYNGGAGSNPLHADSVTVELRETLSPYNVLASQLTVLRTDGTITATYPTSMLGQAYYISIKGRNFIEIWSKSPVTLNSITNYDFRTP